ncbi:MAG: LPS-assembly protein LptD [Bacteroidales bacterium]|nr:LPS-assembly protein LptD [Bacteroidales bacterium]
MLWLLQFGVSPAFSQPENNPISGSIRYNTDTLLVSDTVKKPAAQADTTQKPIDLEHDLIRHAKDSIVQDLKNKMVYLYGDADITYGDINIKAAYISVDFNNNTLFAKGVKDSTGKVVGIPVFKQGDQSFKSKTLQYDFTSKKGIITDVRTEQGEGFLEGNTVKRMPDNSINIKGGYYTTCDNSPPDYEFRFGKARVIPNKLIVTGPVYMQIEGIPLPLALPFGIFPNNPTRKSGLIMPTFGESAKLGFYLQGGGYFWYINDHLTLKVTGDVYTGGSWKVAPVLTYKKRYKYSGALSLGIARNIISTKDSPDYSNTRSFNINWTYSQDTKAHPNSSFSANVNIMSSQNYVKYNTVSMDQYLSNQFNSSISYQKSWAGKYFLTVGATHSQNINQHIVSITLPNVTFSVNTFYPFQNKNNPGSGGPLSKLSVGYNLQMSNSVTATDSTFFMPDTLRRYMRNGIIQSIPISIPIKVLKYFTLSSSLNITDRIYAQSIRKNWITDSVSQDGLTNYGHVKTDTVMGFNNLIDYSISTSLSTKLYGMVQFKKGPVRAIRHVITPSVGFSYVPNFGDSKWGYTGQYTDGAGFVHTYSRFEGALYGAPPMQKSGSVNFSISNNLQIKVPSKKDTVTGLKTVPLIENFTVSGNYNLAKDSVRMSNIYLSGRTTLWKGLNIQYNGLLDIYAVDSAGRDINKTEWEINRKLFRMPSSTWNLSFNFSLSEKDFQKKKKGQESKQQETGGMEGQKDPLQGEQTMMGGELGSNNEVNWKIPWSVNFSYNFTYTNTKSYLDQTVLANKRLIQTLQFGGQISITPKWKVSATSGWDFTNNQLSFTQMQIARDLHCWKMSFSWIPLGPRKSWNFTLQLKAQLLKDLKLTKTKDFRDNY